MSSPTPSGNEGTEKEKRYFSVQYLDVYGAKDDGISCVAELRRQQQARRINNIERRRM